MARGSLERRAAIGLAVGCMVGYSIWAASLRSFTLASYASVAIPVLATVIAVFAMWRNRLASGAEASAAGGSEVAPLIPWMVILGSGLVLEVIGLALGGRSPTVPTLSTVLDHAVDRQVLRTLLFCAWLLLGVLILRAAASEAAS
jgi:hypothetical protein